MYLGSDNLEDSVLSPRSRTVVGDSMLCTEKGKGADNLGLVLPGVHKMVDYSTAFLRLEEYLWKQYWPSMKSC